MPTVLVRQEVPLFAEQWDARLNAAFEHLRAEQPDAAYEAFMRHLEQHPDDANAYEGAAVALLQQLRWDEAQQLTERGTRRMP
jgi:Tfp pilus assembly protein PilF